MRIGSVLLADVPSPTASYSTGLRIHGPENSHSAGLLTANRVVPVRLATHT